MSPLGGTKGTREDHQGLGRSRRGVGGGGGVLGAGVREEPVAETWSRGQEKQMALAADLEGISTTERKVPQ